MPGHGSPPHQAAQGTHRFAEQRPQKQLRAADSMSGFSTRANKSVQGQAPIAATPRNGAAAAKGQAKGGRHPLCDIRQAIQTGDAIHLPCGTPTACPRLCTDCATIKAWQLAGFLSRCRSRTSPPAAFSMNWACRQTIVTLTAGSSPVTAIFQCSLAVLSTGLAIYLVGTRKAILALRTRQPPCIPTSALC